MRVDVDKAGAGNAALGVENVSGRGRRKVAEGHDAALLNGDVAAERRPAAAIEELGVAD